MIHYISVPAPVSIGLESVQRESKLSSASTSTFLLHGILTWCRALRRPNQLSSTTRRRFAFQAPPEQASTESALSYGIENPIPPLPSPQLADQYFDLVYNHVQAQYGFLDWHALRAWHQNREQICLTRPMVGSGQGTDHARGLAAFLLWLVYGYGARLMEERKIEGAVSHEVRLATSILVTQRCQKLTVRSTTQLQ